MSIKSCFARCALVVVLGAVPSHASADIINFTNPGAFNNALTLFGITSLDVDFVPNSTGNPLQGQTSLGLFYDFFTSVDDTLRAQNINTLESIDGSFDDLLIDAALPGALFRSIRFQINPDLIGQEMATLTIAIEDQFGSNPPFIFPLTGGGNFFFGAIGTNGQFIDTVSLTGLPMDTVHNIEIGDPIPEPGTLLLVGSGLALGMAKVGKRYRSRLKADG